MASQQISKFFIAHDAETAGPSGIQQTTGLQIRRHEDSFLRFRGIDSQRRQVQNAGIQKQQRIAVNENRQTVLQGLLLVTEHQVQASLMVGGGC